MSHSNLIACDGCGQPASSEHIARRLLRLEWATRYRPIHMQTLLLGAISPATNSEFLYSTEDKHEGDAQAVLAAAGIETAAKSADVIHAEFQRRGMYLTHVLECPLSIEDEASAGAGANKLLSSRLPLLFTRIRRSLKPKRVVLISGALGPFKADFLAAQLGCEVILDDGHPFALDNRDPSAASRAALKLQHLLRGTAVR
jgi:hypothetical protein